MANAGDKAKFGAGYGMFCDLGCLSDGLGGIGVPTGSLNVDVPDLLVLNATLLLVYFRFSMFVQRTRVTLIAI